MSPWTTLSSGAGSKSDFLAEPAVIGAITFLRKRLEYQAGQHDHTRTRDKDKDDPPDDQHDVLRLPALKAGAIVVADHLFATECTERAVVLEMMHTRTS